MSTIEQQSTEHLTRYVSDFICSTTLAGLPQDVVDVSSDKGCVGRLFFKIPGGIAYGQHWLNVKFEKSVVRVPFRILTADEEKLLSKNYKSIEQQVKDAFTPKK